MRHIPHLLIPGPWEKAELETSDLQQHHLLKVLRLTSGSPVSYTDGAGTVGSGAIEGPALLRGEEHFEAQPMPPVALAVAPPKSIERARYVVEKLAELGVDRLVWMQAKYGEGRSPREEKTQSWASGALEQSRGAWLMAVEPLTPPRAPTDFSPLWVAVPGGPPPPRVVDGGMILIGPEAGLADEEVPSSAVPLGLGKRVLRVETAAVSAATLILDRSGRLRS